MNTKTKLSGYILVISILTLIALFFYIVQTSYAKILKTSQSDDPTSAIDLKLIDTNLSLEVLEEIRKRQEYSSSDYQFIPTPTPIDFPNPNDQSD